VDKKGLTLVEIIVSVLILALVMTGIANIFLAGKRHIGHTRSKIQGAELARLFLAPLQKHVRQDTWDSTSPLQIGKRDCANQPECPSQDQRTLDGITYNANYEISNVSVGAGTTLPLRKVKVKINWNEPQAQ